MTPAATLRERLAQHAENSNFTLEDWEQSLLALDQWLLANPRPMILEDKLGYISCCAEFARGQSVKLALSFIVQEMLREHGVLEP